MVVLKTLFLAAIALLAVATVLVLSGVYDVAAATPHSELTHWVLQTTMRHSVTRRAANLEAPGSMDARRVRRGAAQYGVLCTPCHGAPGVEPTAIGRGLNPAPPDLQESAPQWSEEELFWIASNGIKFTGMPDFGSTTSEETLWDIVAFVAKSPELSEEDYRELVAP